MPDETRIEPDGRSFDEVLANVRRRARGEESAERQQPALRDPRVKPRQPKLVHRTVEEAIASVGALGEGRSFRPKTCPICHAVEQPADGSGRMEIRHDEEMHRRQSGVTAAPAKAEAEFDPTPRRAFGERDDD